ncbi:MAG: BamA/TamA family outer membrane protein, partial [Candidatus Binatia bacterium]
PTRGIFDSLRLRYGSPAFGSDLHFMKLIVQHSQYVPFGGRLTWLYSGRVALAEPLGGNSAIPLRERFFLGGRTTVRGFSENSIGPRGGAGHPTGGDLLFIVNTELRFPLAYGITGAAFADGGGLYLRDRTVSIAEFRESAGPGIRYQTPIGALSLDYGFKLQRRRGESIGELHFTIGNLF